METGHPSTRAVNSGSGNRALLGQGVTFGDHIKLTGSHDDDDDDDMTGRLHHYAVKTVSGGRLVRQLQQLMSWN